MLNESLEATNGVELGGIHLLDTSHETLNQHYPEYLQRFLKENGKQITDAFKLKGPLGKLALWETLGKLRSYYPPEKDFEEMFGVFDFDEQTSTLSFFGMRGEFDKVDIKYIIDMAPSMIVDNIRADKRFVFLHTHPDANLDTDKNLGMPEQFSDADKDRFFELTQKYSREAFMASGKLDELPQLQFMVVHPRGWHVVSPEKTATERNNFEQKNYRYDSLESSLADLDRGVFDVLDKFHLQSQVQNYIPDAIATHPQLQRALAHAGKLYPKVPGEKTGAVNPYEKVITVGDMDLALRKAEEEVHQGYETAQERMDRIVKGKNQIIEPMRNELMPRFDFLDEVSLPHGEVAYEMKESSVALLPSYLKAVLGRNSPIIAFDSLSAPQRFARSDGAETFPLANTKIAFRDGRSGILFHEQNGKRVPTVVPVDGLPMVIESVGAGRWESDDLLKDGFTKLSGTLSDEEASLIYQKDPRAIAKYSYMLNGTRHNAVLRFAYLNPHAEALYRMNFLMEHKNEISSAIMNQQTDDMVAMVQNTGRSVEPIKELKAMLIALKLVHGETIQPVSVEEILGSSTLEI